MPLFGPPNVERLRKKRDAEALIDALTDENASVRCDAALALGELSDARAVEPLITALDDEDGHVRKVAKTALGRIGGRRANDALQAIAADEKARREEARQSGLQALLETLRDEDPKSRRSALETMSKAGYVKTIRQLERSGDCEAERTVAASLKDEEVDVRCAAARALGSIGSVGAARVLAGTLEDMQGDPAVRAAAWVALTASRGAALPVDTLDTRFLTHALAEDWLLRRQAAKVLLDRIEEFCDRRAVQPLSELLREARSSAPRGYLGGGHFDTASLEERLNRPARLAYGVVARAIGALRLIGDRGGVAAIAEWDPDCFWERVWDGTTDTDDETYPLREIWVQALEELGGPDAERALAEYRARQKQEA